MVAKRQDASVGMLGEVVAHPGLLRRALRATAELFRIAVGVQDDDVPRAEVEAVVAFLRLACLFAPVVKIADGLGTVVLVVAGRWISSVSKLTPCPVVAAELRVRAPLIGEITCCENSSVWNTLNDFSCSLGAG